MSASKLKRSSSSVKKLNGHSKLTVDQVAAKKETSQQPQQQQQQQKQLEFNVKQLVENYIASFEEEEATVVSEATNMTPTTTTTTTAKYEFEYFLSTLKQKQADEKLIESVLGQLRPIIPLLEPARFENNLVNDLFVNIKWHVHYSNNRRVLDLLTELLVDLNSAYTNYIQKCLNMIIRLFFTTTTATSVIDGGDNRPINCANMYKLAHEVLDHMIKTAPSCKPLVTKQLEQLFPYMNKETSVQEAYMQNLLMLAERFVDLRQKILEICVQKMLKIDVNCPREQILTSLAATAAAAAETTTTEEVDDEQEEDAANNLEENKTLLSDRLDAMMLCMFNYINRNCFNGNSQSTTTTMTSEVINWDMAKSIYKDLLFAFDKYVLLTYGSSHVQFLLFYVCSMRASLAEGFLDYLWKKFNSIKSCSITKQICAYYLGSLLARAKYISLTTCTATLHLMITWILSYIEKHHSGSGHGGGHHNHNNVNHQFDLHRTFYTLCQTVFYVVIFRNRQLFIVNEETIKKKTSSSLAMTNHTSTTMTTMIKSWKLNTIVTSKLNPLRYCLPSITKKFAKITYMHQVAYCYAVMDANNRITLPFTNGNGHNSHKATRSSSVKEIGAAAAASVLLNVSSGGGDTGPLFPFDPYLLSNSKRFVESFYVEYKDVVDDDDDDDDQDSETDDDDDEESDETSSDSSDDDDSDTSDDTKKKSRKRKMLDFDDSDLDNSVE